MRAPAAVLAFLAAFAGADASAYNAVHVHVDVKTTFQTWEAWSCVPNPPGFERPFGAWCRDPSNATYDRVPVNRALPAKLIGRMHDALVGEIGITRVRLELGPQAEFVNDDADPMHADPKGFRFAWQDDYVEQHVLPIKRRVEAAGERVVIYVSFDLRSKLTPAHLLEPAEYAELAVTFLGHLKSKHGIEPDYWSVLNEPGNERPGNPKLCAELTAAAGRRIAAAGFRTKMSGPEVVTVAQADAYMRAMTQTEGALDHFRQITYHLYHRGAEDVAARNAVRDWAKKLKVTAAQTEWMEASDLDVARHIHLCLTEADAVAWDRFGADLFFALPYNAWLDPKSDDLVPPLSSTAWHIRQFSRFIRPGAVRVGLRVTLDDDGHVRGTAFLPKGGTQPVVVLLNTSSTAQYLDLTGFPAGRYDCSFTSAPLQAFGKDQQTLELGDARGRQNISLAARSVTTLAPSRK